VAKWLGHRRRQRKIGQQWQEEIRPRVEADRAERARLLVGKEELVSAIEALLFAADPIGINFEHNTDEYRPEAETIALRIPETATVDELHRIVFEEFVRWFGDPDRRTDTSRSPGTSGSWFTAPARGDPRQGPHYELPAPERLIHG
jgi:hypothetical protein